ncbi:hypothetical protein Tco_1008363, partial [Tanacetum coccineum]
LRKKLVPVKSKSCQWQRLKKDKIESDHQNTQEFLNMNGVKDVEEGQRFFYTASMLSRKTTFPLHGEADIEKFQVLLA